MMADESDRRHNGGDQPYTGIRPPPALDQDHALELAELIRRVAYGDLQEVSDRAFERIEKRVEEVVEAVAPRVVPRNIAKMIETIVTNRTAAIEQTLSTLLTKVARWEGQVAVGDVGLLAARKVRRRVKVAKAKAPKAVARPKPKKRRRRNS